MKTVGIIGGLGPDTTAQFYLQIVSGVSSKAGIQRPRILINSVPIPLSVEKDCIVKGEVGRVLPFLTSTAKQLQRGGADFIVMPCNSLHVFVENIRESVDIPVLSIVQETVSLLKKSSVKKVGVVSTLVTRESQLYQTALNDVEITSILPDAPSQIELGHIIHRLVCGQVHERDKATLEQITASLGNNGASHVILACTDLQLLVKKLSGLEVVDTMQILAKATVREILK